MVSLIASLVTIFGLGVPIWWFVKTRESRTIRKRQWWAIATGALLILSVATQSTAPYHPYASRAEQLGAAMFDLIVIYGAIWLFMWGLRGRIKRQPVKHGKLPIA